MGSKERIYADVMAMNPEVTGSCNLVIAKLPNGETIRFVVDCGLFQEHEYSCLNEKLPFKPENIDFCIVTHNHVDHTGRLPYMVKNGFSKAIYLTEATCKFLPLALRDSCKVLKDIAKRNNVKSIYGEESINPTLALLKPCRFNEKMEVHPNVTITFLTNGHLIGAALVLVQISYPGIESINMLFTGDYNNKNMFFDVEPIPKWVLDLPLTIIQESTYGDMDSTEIKESFENNIINRAENEGTSLVMVFSLGRSQEIMYVLRRMQMMGKLDFKIPIYIDGNLCIEYTKIFLNGELNLRPDMQEFMPQNYTFVNKGNREFVLYGREPKIILTTSGMGSYGPAQTYIPEYIARENSLIQFTGYTAEGTLGNYLKKAEFNDIVQIGGLYVEKKADVEYTTEFSAHAKADEMISFLKKFKNIKMVLVNHGETDTKEEFAKRVLREVKPKNVGVLGRENFFRINPYGLVKTLPTKFS